MTSELTELIHHFDLGLHCGELPWRLIVMFSTLFSVLTQETVGHLGNQREFRGAENFCAGRTPRLSLIHRKYFLIQFGERG